MKGGIITARKGIADVFEEFHAKLYDDDEEHVRKLEAEMENDTCKKNGIHRLRTRKLRSSRHDVQSIDSNVARPVTPVQS